MVCDDKGTILTSSMNKSLVGQSFFSNYTQDFFNHNKILMNLTKSLVTGKASYARYDYGTGEILPQSPLLINGKLRYFVQLNSPTKEIISQLSEALFSERLKMTSLLGGSLPAIAVLTIYLIKWNKTLQKQVRIKTQELLEAEIIQRQLEESVEGVKHYLDEVKKEIKREKTGLTPITGEHQHSCSRQYFFGVYKKALLFEIKLLPNIKNKRKKKDYLPYHFRMVYKNNK